MAFIKKVLKDKDAVNSKDIKLSTPLHWACYTGAENSILYLTAWKAEVNV
jgi:ankyrin repeat protein